MIVGVPVERTSGERRVSLSPESIAALTKLGCTALVESGAGRAAGWSDEDYRTKGATVAASRDEILRDAQLILGVRLGGARSDEPLPDARHVAVGQCDPFGEGDGLERLVASGARLFSLELLPRTTRAQAMDVLSSQASIVGYKAALLAAGRLERMLPMMMTAAGTIRPAKALVIGAGVAGLQAIATLRRLGAIVEAYDVRPAAKEQIESLGAKAIEVDLPGASAEGKGGYAKAMDESFYARQRERLATAVAASDIVITTAAVPGGRAPLLVTEDAVRAMRPGSVVVDLAAARGGNCALTRPDEDRDEGGVLILGPTNLAASVAADASLLYGRNMTAFLGVIVRNGALSIDRTDELVAGTLIAEGGRLIHPDVLAKRNARAAASP